MKTQLTKIISAAAIAALLPLMPCYAANPSELAGQWFNESNGESIELFKDGTGLVEGKISISWKVENKRLAMLSPLAGMASNYKISGSKLILNYDNGKSETFVRKAEYERIKKKKEEERKRQEEEERKKEEEKRNNALNLTVTLSDMGCYIEIWARGGSLPKIFFKEHKNSAGNIELWTLLKAREDDPGTVQMSVYSKSDSAYLNSNNEFIANIEEARPGSIVATISENSKRRLACGQSAPGVEDICRDGMPAISLKPRSAYDEFAKSLIMIRNRFIDSHDADNITILADDDTDASKINSLLQRAKAAGFTKIALKKLTARSSKSNFSAYNLMKDKNFAKDIDNVLKNVAGLQTSGKTELGDRRSEDSRSKEEIMAVVNARMPGLVNIYNKHLSLKPGFNGKVTLKFTIAPSGDIANIGIVSSTTGYGEFDNAIKNMVATWKWKVIKSGNTTPTIPFSFGE